MPAKSPTTARPSLVVCQVRNDVAEFARIRHFRAHPNSCEFSYTSIQDGQATRAGFKTCHPERSAALVGSA